MKSLWAYSVGNAILAIAALLAEASSSVEWILGAVVAAFVALYTTVVVPMIASVRKEVRAARADASEARHRSMECELWRAKYEETIDALQLASLTAVIVTVKDGDDIVIEHVNHAAVTLFGYSLTEFVGMNPEDLIDPSQRSSHHAKVKLWNADSGPVVINRGQAIDKAGKRFLVTVSISNSIYQGQPAITASITRDQ